MVGTVKRHRRWCGKYRSNLVVGLVSWATCSLLGVERGDVFAGAPRSEFLMDLGIIDDIDDDRTFRYRGLIGDNEVV